MTDEELVKRLRDAVNGEHDMTPHGADCLQAADRIEALTAKLAKAMEGLRSIAANTCCTPCQEAALVARAIIAEIEGEKT
jgi:hypothetical protein